MKATRRTAIKTHWVGKQKHRRSQLITSAAIVTAVVVSYLFNYAIPDLKHYAPLAGLAASMLWVWSE